MVGDDSFFFYSRFRAIIGTTSTRRATTRHGWWWKLERSGIHASNESPKSKRSGQGSTKDKIESKIRRVCPTGGLWGRKCALKCLGIIFYRTLALFSRRPPEELNRWETTGINR